MRLNSYIINKIFLIIILLNIFIYCQINQIDTVRTISQEPILFEESTKRLENSSLIEFDKIQIGNLTSSNRSNSWIIPNLIKNVMVYFSITPIQGLTLTDLQINTYSPESEIFAHSEIQTTGNSRLLGKWETYLRGNYTIQINSTREVNGTYALYTLVKKDGFNFNTAYSLINNVIQTENFTINQESHYWKIYMNRNQIGNIKINENSQNVLRNSEVTITGSKNPNNPVLEEIMIESELNRSWVAGQADIYYIIISHSIDSDSKGFYNITYVPEDEGYDWETAIPVEFNITKSYFIEEKTSSYYFRVPINLSNVIVNIDIWEESPESSTVLDNSVIEIFDPQRQTPIVLIRELIWTGWDGIINASFRSNTIGDYFIIVSPYPDTDPGRFNIRYWYEYDFSWNLLAIMTSFLILIGLPMYLSFLDYKGKFTKLTQWTIEQDNIGTFKLIKNKLRSLFSINEVPNESILVKLPGLIYDNFVLIRFIESTENETLVFIKRIKKNFDYIIHIAVAILLYDLLNVVGYALFSIHTLPIYLPNIGTLIIILVIPTAIILSCVLFFNVPSSVSYQRLIKQLSSYIDNIHLTEEISFQPKEIQKKINYVRVLWNQAKHAYKEKRFNFFVIKADTAIKNLVDIRYNQISPNNSNIKRNFQSQVDELRNWGYDLPSEKRITRFRNLRNQIVHSSVTLDEKDSITCFDYYSTFISRLGLRAT